MEQRSDFVSGSAGPGDNPGLRACRFCPHHFSMVLLRKFWDRDLFSKIRAFFRDINPEIINRIKTADATP